MLYTQDQFINKTVQSLTMQRLTHSIPTKANKPLKHTPIRLDLIFQTFLVNIQSLELSTLISLILRYVGLVFKETGWIT